MPRPSALASVSITALQAEIERRVSKLSDLLKLRDQVDKDIAQLQALAGQFGKVVAAEAPAKPVRRRRRKAKAVKVMAKPLAPKGKRGYFRVNAATFVLGLLRGRTLTTKEIVARWRRAGRGGKADNVLTQLVKAGQVKREKIAGEQGSKYSVA
jgi:chorismate mutase